MKKAKQISLILILILSICSLIFGVLSCLGSNSGGDGNYQSGGDGNDGEDGEGGGDGLDGEAGAAGLSCWDLDENGEKDIATEDLNGDLIVNVLDCSFFCWDSNGNKVKDTEEDVNGDGVVDASDCTMNCIDEDEDGYCDTVGGGTNQCDPDDPTCIDVCADEATGIDSVEECFQSCLLSLYDDIEEEAVAAAAAGRDPINICTDFNPETGEEEQDTATACGSICEQNCADFVVEEGDCPPAYIIPDYYKKKEIKVEHCSVYDDFLIINDNYMIFESMQPAAHRTIVLEHESWNNIYDWMGLGDGFDKHMHNDNTAVGMSRCCSFLDSNVRGKAQVTIDGEEYQWVWPAADYFEFTDPNIDRSEPIFVVFTASSGRAISRAPIIRDNHHRNGQLSYMVRFRNTLAMEDWYWWWFLVYRSTSSVTFNFYYKPLDMEETETTTE